VLHALNPARRVATAHGLVSTAQRWVASWHSA
jgi:hypothetical protein